MRVNSDLTKILTKEHEGKWAALTKDRSKLIGFADTLVDLRDKLAEKKDDFVYMKVLRSEFEYSFELYCELFSIPRPDLRQVSP